MMKPSIEYLRQRIKVDTEKGVVTWVDATRHHKELNGLEAGCSRRSSHHNKRYWYVKIDSLALKRSHIVFLFGVGHWPVNQVDHINGNSLDDRITNLRGATSTQNAWNHKHRAKQSPTPMGVRQTKSGRYQARIACNKKQIAIGTFETAEQAFEIYQQKRKELFGDYA